jgi:hypothetical protein
LLRVGYQSKWKIVDLLHTLFHSIWKNATHTRG